MKHIPLGRSGKVAIVDDDDYAAVSQYKWCIRKGHSTDYAQRNIWIGNRRTVQSMHNFVTGEAYVDHKNHNGLDNRKVNLRPCDKSRNQRNRIKNKGCVSEYKGVTWHKRDLVWEATARGFYLGRFDTEIEAAQAYDRYARKHFGEFALLNFPARQLKVCLRLRRS